MGSVVGTVCGGCGLPSFAAGGRGEARSDAFFSMAGAEGVGVGVAFADSGAGLCLFVMGSRGDGTGFSTTSVSVGAGAGLPSFDTDARGVERDAVEAGGAAGAAWTSAAGGAGAAPSNDPAFGSLSAVGGVFTAAGGSGERRGVPPAAV